jgi:hypothetical protein
MAYAIPRTLLSTHACSRALRCLGCVSPLRLCVSASLCVARHGCDPRAGSRHWATVGTALGHCVWRGQMRGTAATRGHALGIVPRSCDSSTNRHVHSMPRATDNVATPRLCCNMPCLVAACGQLGKAGAAVRTVIPRGDGKRRASSAARRHRPADVSPPTSAPGLGSAHVTSAPGLGLALAHLHRDLTVPLLFWDCGRSCTPAPRLALAPAVSLCPPLPHVRRMRAHPVPHLHWDCAPPPATSAPRLGSPLPHLRRHSAALPWRRCVCRPHEFTLSLPLDSLGPPEPALGTHEACDAPLGPISSALIAP